MPDTGLIIAAVDGSPASTPVLQWAARQAHLTNGTLRAVMAWELPYSPLATLAFDPERYEDNAKEALSQAVIEALGVNVNLEEQVVQGYAAEVLIEESRSADLLVVGSRGHGGFVGMLIGSVSHHVTAHAHCPVVVVRSDPREHGH